MAPRLNPLRLSAEIAFNGLVAEKPIRLGKVRQQTDRTTACAATKPPHGKPQILAAGARQPTLVISQSDKRLCRRAIGTTKRSRHPVMLLRDKIVLRRPLHPDNDLQSCANLRTNEQYLQQAYHLVRVIERTAKQSRKRHFLSDEHHHLPATGDYCVDEVPLKEQVVLHRHRRDNHREFRSLGFVNADCVARCRLDIRHGVCLG